MNNFEAIFGTAAINLNVTECVTKNFRENNKIIIPNGNYFNKYFGDPCPGILKNLTIKLGTRKYEFTEQGNGSYFKFVENI